MPKPRTREAYEYWKTRVGYFDDIEDVRRENWKQQLREYYFGRNADGDPSRFLLVLRELLAKHGFKHRTSQDLDYSRSGERAVHFFYLVSPRVASAAKQPENKSSWEHDESIRIVYHEAIPSHQWGLNLALELAVFTSIVSPQRGERCRRKWNLAWTNLVGPLPPGWWSPRRPAGPTALEEVPLDADADFQLMLARLDEGLRCVAALREASRLYEVAPSSLANGSYPNLLAHLSAASVPTCQSCPRLLTCHARGGAKVFSNGGYSPAFRW